LTAKTECLADPELERAAKARQPVRQSNIAEQISRVPKVPYLAAEGQLVGHEDEWAEINDVERAVV
jgi:hypothetical protein